MTTLLKDPSFSGKKLDEAIRGYFEVISCDEMDIFISLFGFSNRFMKRLKIEGEENLREALNNGRGILLTAHFGGGFWILPFLKQKGIRCHFFSNDIRKEDYPSKKALYFYERLGNWVVEKVSGERVLFKRHGRRDILWALKEGRWVIVLFDVPSSLVKENKEVTFLGRRTWFPKGIISIAKEMNVPLLPFFSFLDEGKHRRICFEEPIYVQDENECVERSVRLIEKRILERPDHWHMWPFADQFFPQ